MKATRISLTISEICKHLDIDYESVNQECQQMMNDAKRLAEIYRDLKIIAGDLQAIEERHQLNGLSELLRKDIEALEKADHDIIRIAQKLREDNA